MFDVCEYLVAAFFAFDVFGVGGEGGDVVGGDRESGDGRGEHEVRGEVGGCGGGSWSMELEEVGDVWLVSCGWGCGGGWGVVGGVGVIRIVGVIGVVGVVVFV